MAAPDIAHLDRRPSAPVAGPRVQFVRGMRTDAHHPDVGQVSWRLLGGNHRELGRSPLSYSSLSATRDAVTALQAALSSAVTTVVAAPDTHLWTWRVRVAEVTQLVSSRSYQRRRESVSNLARALDALAAAGFITEELILQSARRGVPRPALAARLEAIPRDVN